MTENRRWTKHDHEKEAAQAIVKSCPEVSLHEMRDAPDADLLHREGFHIGLEIVRTADERELSLRGRLLATSELIQRELAAQGVRGVFWVYYDIQGMFDQTDKRAWDRTVPTALAGLFKARGAVDVETAELVASGITSIARIEATEAPRTFVGCGWRTTTEEGNSLADIALASNTRSSPAIASRTATIFVSTGSGSRAWGREPLRTAGSRCCSDVAITRTTTAFCFSSTTRVAGWRARRTSRPNARSRNDHVRSSIMEHMCLPGFANAAAADLVLARRRSRRLAPALRKWDPGDYALRLPYRPSIDSTFARTASRQLAGAISSASEIERPVQQVQRVRVGEFAQLWMKSKALALDVAVAKTYASALEQHVLPVFGDLYYDAFTDLTRLAKVAVTRRALTGHVTEQMQRHYSTVDVAEKREAMEAAMGVLKAAKAEADRKKSVNSGVN